MVRGVGEFAHIPVLLDEVAGALAPAAGETYVDATAGLGGHAASVGERLGGSGTIVLNDVDPANAVRAAARVGAMPDPPVVHAVTGNFVDLPRRLAELGVAADMMLADLGFASNQVDDAGRGLSFRREGPLDMRLDPSLKATAADLVNTLPEAELAELIRTLGEERGARRIAAKIVATRAESPIRTTSELAAVVRDAVGGRPTPRASARRSTGRAPIDPATKTFQAMRIAVNDELGCLDALLEAIERDASRAVGAAGRWLASGARVAILTFHSLEDRPVKRSFAQLVKRGRAEAIVRKPASASADEVDANPRARSARLRAIRLV
ncbi:MAG: 16S rRNA (cytosine(1402)-N(4))-methyltransferase RsmH [Planctomycetota bacterium]